MTNIGDNIYSCDVTGLIPNELIEYYFKATANNGKIINRPIVAPEGAYEFMMEQYYPYSQTIELNQGWNIISTYINRNVSIEDLFESVEENIVIVKNNLGIAYLPDWDFNGIGELNPLEGYYVKTTNSTLLNINGVFMIPEENPIPLNSGWSTISYLRLDEVSADIIF